MDAVAQFHADRSREQQILGEDKQLAQKSLDWLMHANQLKYSYQFDWLGRPIIQYPQDIVATQELIWKVQPDLIIETGIAHGGSLILSASLLAMLEYCEAAENGGVLDPQSPKRMVLGVDIDIREHNRASIEKHPMASRIKMVQGSSIEQSTIHKVVDYSSAFRRVLVMLDSNHTHEHVLEELNAYSPLVSLDSYCVVFDTIVEDMPAEMFPDRSWAPGNSPKSAVFEFLKTHPEFEIDRAIDYKLQISVAPHGFLKRVG